MTGDLSSDSNNDEDLTSTTNSLVPYSRSNILARSNPTRSENTRRPLLSTTPSRSPSPSMQNPTSAPLDLTSRSTDSKNGMLSGFGVKCGKVQSREVFPSIPSKPSSRSTRGTVIPPVPFPVSTATLRVGSSLNRGPQADTMSETYRSRMSTRRVYPPDALAKTSGSLAFMKSLNIPISFGVK